MSDPQLATIGFIYLTFMLVSVTRLWKGNDRNFDLAGETLGLSLRTLGVWKRSWPATCFVGAPGIALLCIDLLLAGRLPDPLVGTGSALAILVLPTILVGVARRPRFAIPPHLRDPH